MIFVIWHYNNFIQTDNIIQNISMFDTKFEADEWIEKQRRKSRPNFNLDKYYVFSGYERIVY